LKGEDNTGKEPQQEIYISEADIALAEIYMAAPDAEQASHNAPKKDAEV
jgi:hypothetical protein